MRAQQIPVPEIAAVPILVLARQDTRAAGHADGGRVIVIVKHETVASQLVQVRCLHVLVAIATHGVSALVVG